MGKWINRGLKSLIHNHSSVVHLKRQGTGSINSSTKTQNLKFSVFLKTKSLEDDLQDSLAIKWKHVISLEIHIYLSSSSWESSWGNRLFIIACRISCLWFASGGCSSTQHWNMWHPLDVSSEGCNESWDLLVAMTTTLLLWSISALTRSLITGEWKKKKSFMLSTWKGQQTHGEIFMDIRWIKQI